MIKSIIISGIAGQGTVLATRLLVKGLMEVGYDVKLREVHEIEQRSDSISLQVRFGKCVESPAIYEGEADMLLSFEKTEALRWLKYLKPQGKIVVNDCHTESSVVLSQKTKNRTSIVEELKKKAETKVVNGIKFAEELGNFKVMNVILLGAAIKVMGLEQIYWEKIIRDNVKPQYTDINLKAFQTGINAIN